MRLTYILITLLYSSLATGQVDLTTPFKDCKVQGSTSIYDYKNKKWIFSDASDANIETLPASTFKIINLLIALETRVIKDENEVVKFTSYICMKAFDGSIVNGWLASQTDILSEDWNVLD